jgi:hypothetical protein
MDALQLELLVTVLGGFSAAGLAFKVWGTEQVDTDVQGLNLVERRVERRSPMSIRANVVSAGTAFSCSIVELGEHGAKLMFDKPCFLIRDVRLEWGDEKVACQVTRSTKSTVAVRFLRRVPLLQAA